jgi:urease accessory protein
MDLIREPIAFVHSNLTRVELVVDRHTLAKRRWRGTAADGREFGFDLQRPLQHGESFFQTDSSHYAVAQEPEPLLAISLLDPEQAARVAWQIGNLHFPLALRHDLILVEEDVALRQMFEREQIVFRSVREIFQPLIAAAGHHHDHGHHHH